jgi:hypothetical protein
MSQGTARTAIDVVIINWNTAEAAIEATKAYLASDSVEARVTVVDNASQPEQQARLKEGCPEEARLMLQAENLGYGRAANLALGDGTAGLVCVSNADVLPEPDALATLAAVAQGEDRVGMVGPAFGGKTDRYHSRLPTGVTMAGRIFAGTFSRGPVPPPSDAARLGGAIHQQAPSATRNCHPTADAPLDTPQSDGPDDAEPSPRGARRLRWIASGPRSGGARAPCWRFR